MTMMNEILEHAYTHRETEKGRRGWENCSGFVRMVAARLHVKLEGQQADDQLAYMERHWIKLKDATHALEMASRRHLVVAGLKSNEYEPPRENGHVVIVQPLRPAQMPVGPEDMYLKRYPYVWGGDKGRKFMTRGDRSIGEIINRKVRDKVRYYTPPGGPHAPEFR